MPLTTSTSVRQLSDGNSVGTVMGTAPTDKIGFYGLAAGVVQPSGAAQAAVTRGQACGIIATFGSTQSPSLVQAGTAAEGSLTVTGTTALFKVAATDLLFVNKPTSQAGLGVGNVRGASANTAGVMFSNLTGTSITPTASEKYGVLAIRGMPTIAQTLTPTSVAASTTVEQLFTVAGLRVGELVQVNKPSAQAGLDIVGCRVAAANQLGITFMNVSLAAITPTAESYIIFSLGGLDAVNNSLMLQAKLSVAVDVGGAAAKEISVVFTGLATTDAVVGISKPTAQTGLGLAGQRAQTSANSLAITFANPSAATITPTASEVYSVLAQRPNPAAPLVVYSQALTPASVPAQSSAEQTFTVTGLVAGSAVWVNKPSTQTGLGIAGVRVSAANQLAINFVNTSAVSITPTAAETYVIGNFQAVITDDGNTFMQSASPTSQAQSLLANATRAALGPSGVNLIAGA